MKLLLIRQLFYSEALCLIDLLKFMDTKLAHIW